MVTFFVRILHVTADATRVEFYIRRLIGLFCREAKFESRQLIVRELLTESTTVWRSENINSPMLTQNVRQLAHHEDGCVAVVKANVCH